MKLFNVCVVNNISEGENLQSESTWLQPLQLLYDSMREVDWIWFSYVDATRIITTSNLQPWNHNHTMQQRYQSIISDTCETNELSFYFKISWLTNMSPFVIKEFLIFTFIIQEFGGQHLLTFKTHRYENKSCGEIGRHSGKSGKLCKFLCRVGNFNCFPSNSGGATGVHLPHQQNVSCPRKIISNVLKLA